MGESYRIDVQRRNSCDEAVKQRGQRRMKIGFLTACLRKIELPDLVKWAGQNGFRALELDAGMLENATGAYQGGSLHAEGVTKESAESLLKVMAESKVEISCLTFCHNMLDADLAAREKRIEHLLRVIHAAAILDVDVVSCFVGRNATKDTEQNYGDFQEVFGKIMPVAADSGVRIAVENCPMVGWQIEGLAGNIAYSPVIWKRMFDIFPDMGLNFDPSHLVWMGVDYSKAAKDFAKHIFHVHAKDTEVFEPVLADRGILPPTQPRWWRYRAPGYGVIDWAKFASVLTECGYDGPLSIEHEDPVWRGDDERVKRGLVLGRKHLEQFVV
jgi:sugar phosphate isomerase/epimerase